MTETEALAPICMIGVILCMMTLVSLWVYGQNASSTFILQRRLTKINWRKVAKWYVYIQGFLLFLKFGNPAATWTVTLAIPAILIGLLLISFFFVMDKREDTKDLNSKEFEDFNKAYIRDQKLKKILK